MLIRNYAADLPALPGIELPFAAAAPWRYTLLTGLIPAAAILVLLPFLPESPVWAAKKAAGTLQRPSVAAIFAPRFRRTTIAATLLLACAYAAAFGAIQLTPPLISRAVPQLADERKALKPLQDRAKELNKQFNEAPEESDARQAIKGELKANRDQQRPHAERFEAVKDRMQFWQEMGGLLGRVALAGLALVIVSRRVQLWMFLVPGTFVLPFTFGYAAHESELLLLCGLSLSAFLTVGQYSYWGNYLPAAYPVHLRGTAGGFAVNVGGRMLGTSAAYVTTSLVAPLMPGATRFTQVGYAAAVVGGSVFLIALVVSFFLPEPEASGPPD
jgi:hypothetical protein